MLSGLYVNFLMNFKKVNNSLSPETSDTINRTRAKIIPISFWCPQTVKKNKNCQPGSLKKFQFVHCYITVHVLIVLLKNNDLITVCEQHSWHSFSKRIGLEFQSTENIISIWINLTVHSNCYKVYALFKTCTLQTLTLNLNFSIVE